MFPTSLFFPKVVVDVRDRLGVMESIGAQKPEPVAARFGFDLLFIRSQNDGLPKSLLKCARQGPLSVCILKALFFIETDHLAT